MLISAISRTNRGNVEGREADPNADASGQPGDCEILSRSEISNWQNARFFASLGIEYICHKLLPNAARDR